jgi:hypothetical protein
MTLIWKEKSHEMKPLGEVLHERPFIRVQAGWEKCNWETEEMKLSSYLDELKVKKSNRSQKRVDEIKLVKTCRLANTLNTSLASGGDPP